MSKNSWIFGGVIVLVVVLLGGIFIVGNSGNSTPTSPSATAGLMTGNAPWPANTDKLTTRLGALGLPTEGNALHIHQHFEIFIRGKAITIPANTNIDSAAGVAAPLHIHDTSGVLHVESAVKRDFTLGEFMAAWGLKFDQSDIGGYQADANNKLRIYSNGQLVSGDPRNLKLVQHQEVVITYGSDAELPVPMPATYAFSADL